MDKKAFIEHDFPLKEVSFESAKEKNIRHGHISTLHVWWARKPLACSRASILATLLPEPRNEKEKEELKKLIAVISKWDNSLNPQLLEKARGLIKKVYSGRPPKVLDCFAGGGAIPLEALRLGCETYALDLNPVATVILKATLEYPQKYGQPKKVISDTKDSLFKEEKILSPLLEDVRKWGLYVLNEVQKELKDFFPKENGENPIGYYWVRTAICQNPSCKVEIPLNVNWWISIKSNKNICLKMIVNKKGKKIDFNLLSGKKFDFNPDEGTTKRGSILCPVCNSAMSNSDLMGKKLNERLVVVVAQEKEKSGKTYRLANQNDIKIFEQASQFIKDKIIRFDDAIIPNEPIFMGKIEDTPQWLWANKYGMTTWGDLYNDRQKLVLTTFIDKVKAAYEMISKDNKDKEYAAAILTYLAIAIDRLASFNSSLSWYQPKGEFSVNLFGRQAVGMVWNYFEICPFSKASGDWNSALDWILRVIEHCSLSSNNSANVINGTATNIPFSKDYFDFVVIDPPYYDAVPYSDLSDFFYVLLKRSMGDLYPTLFSTPLTPKNEEVTQNFTRHNGDSQKAKLFFEQMLSKSFAEVHRVLAQDGLAVIVFSHKSTEAWETVINSLLSSGLVLTASWPVHTERTERLSAKETASLASSIYMVCRKRIKDEVAYYDEIKDEIKKRIKDKLAQFWNEGISGSDFFISAIGPAVEVFGRYSKVEKPSGEVVSAKDLLEYVRKVVMEFALERILKNPSLGGIDSETLFYLLWRWTYNRARVQFDDANKLAHGVGVELSNMWGQDGFVRKEKEFISVLDPRERAKEHSFLKKDKFNLMIDVLHRGLVYWEKTEKEKIKDLLDESGFSNNENFWKVSQAISEVLPEGDKEKQLIQGFLYSREAYSKIKKKEASLFAEDKK